MDGEFTVEADRAEAEQELDAAEGRRDNGLPTKPLKGPLVFGASGHSMSFELLDSSQFYH